MGPAEILALGKALEHAAGRRRSDRRSPRFGPRPLDVDLALFGARVDHAPELTIPHPRLTGRRFMLEPLAAVAPDLPVPPDGRTVAELLAALDDPSPVERLDHPGWPPF